MDADDLAEHDVAIDRLAGESVERKDPEEATFERESLQLSLANVTSGGRLLMPLK
jgi:hypothetical protein